MFFFYLEDDEYKSVNHYTLSCIFKNKWFQLVASGYRLKQTANIPDEVYAIIESATMFAPEIRYDLDVIISKLTSYRDICPLRGIERE